MEEILLFILFICFYVVGKEKGKEENTKLIKQYIEQSKDWNEFLEKFSVMWRENIGD